jgi:hypothetical protein
MIILASKKVLQAEVNRLRKVLVSIRDICRNCPSEDIESCGNCLGHSMASIADTQRYPTNLLTKD